MTQETRPRDRRGTQPAGRHERRNVELVYCRQAMNGGLVFATPERAAFVARIHHAIESARTWGEFRTLMPRAEYSAVVRCFDDCGEPRPRSTDAFRPEEVPGYCDGDYPPWLQQEMLAVLPAEVLREFDAWQSSVFNGPFAHIEVRHLAGVIRRLEALGYTVRDGEEIGCWY